MNTIKVRNMLNVNVKNIVYALVDPGCYLRGGHSPEIEVRFIMARPEGPKPFAV